MLYKTIVFAPLVGFLIAGVFGNRIGDKASQWVTSCLLVLSAICSLFAFYKVGLGGVTEHVLVANWVTSGDMVFNWAFQIDTLTAVMLVVVTGVSALVHIYSIGYMSHDPNIPRFMAYLSLFTFAMLMLVTADNFVQMFFGWEGVGLASYLLIGFWYKKPSANAAAIKAFLVNRVGDFGFSLGIFATFLVFGSVDFATVFAAVPGQAEATIVFLGYEFHAMTVICLLLFVGAMGKSAQLGLHTWLPDAMEGPTPVSALIHAATMVTAGVFLVARCSPMFEYAPDALVVVTIIGALTALFAASVGLVQNDIKRVIAYSTCSQLGYMFFALGVSAYGAAIFHLFTHAFFKALLFLGSGSVIHAMSDEQDMRKMGGLRKKIPYTYGLMTIGTLAITGFPFLSGYFSKDMIIESAFAAHTGVGQFAFVIGVSAALMTSFYSWRLVHMTFHGKTRADAHTFDHAHESPMVMLIPLIILALGAIFAGGMFADKFVGDGYEAFWNGSLFLIGENVMEAAHHVPAWVVWSPFAAMVIGFLIAGQFYIRRTDLPAAFARQFDGLYAFLLNKWYFDELYDVTLVRPAKWLGRVLWKRGDGAIIDGFGPDGCSAMIGRISARVRTFQTGYVYHYAFIMIVGILALVSWFSLTGGGI